MIVAHAVYLGLLTIVDCHCHCDARDGGGGEDVVLLGPGERMVIQENKGACDSKHATCRSRGETRCSRGSKTWRQSITGTQRWDLRPFEFTLTLGTPVQWYFHVGQ